MESASRVQASPSVNDLIDRRLVTITAPAAGAAEQFRMLHLRLDRIRERQPLAVIALTSAVPGEGKSISVANLAACAALRGRRVALVDCDLRRPQLAEIFGLPDTPGLASVLGGRKRLEDAIRIGPAGLAVIPGGDGPDDPAALFQGDAFREMLDRLRQTFQEIYLDLPPVLSFADGLAAAGAADGVVLVVRGNRTPAKLAEDAVDQLAGTPLVGCLLTGCGTESAYRSYTRRP